jgi:hypothetical protein
MRERIPAVPALIIGGPWILTLSMIRSLGRKRIPLFATGTADRFACCALFRQGRLSAWSWLREWLGARQLLFSWRDPLPGFARILQHLRVVIGRQRAGVSRA